MAHPINIVCNVTVEVSPTRRYWETVI